ncbi:TfoX/Sxy family protein [Bradyrhizobium sp. STM 3557]|uniref:TfoX/Sxy family protein n=1 Tax=Bradyrhizobium sp. STM 3557 TaxID=578920 RepID=UPI00388E3CF3
MDREFLTDLFADFGPVTIRRMFSGYGISVDGVNFALSLRAGLFFRADDETIPRFEAEGSKPFSYQTSTRSVTVASYWQLPARLFDDTEELSEWARAALGAAQRAALKKRARKPRKSKTAAAAKAAKPPAKARTPEKARTTKARATGKKTPSAANARMKRPPTGKSPTKAEPLRERRKLRAARAPA